MVIPVELDDHLILYCVFAGKFGHVSRLQGMVGHLRELVTVQTPYHPRTIEAPKMCDVIVIQLKGERHKAGASQVQQEREPGIWRTRML